MPNPKTNAVILNDCIVYANINTMMQRSMKGCSDICSKHINKSVTKQSGEFLR